MIKKILEAIWKPYDNQDPLEWYLLCFGWIMLVIILLLQVGNL